MVIDLEVYYNRQFPNLYEIIEESVRIDRNIIKLIMKVILIMEYFVYAGYRMSSRSYGEILDSIARIG